MATKMMREFVYLGVAVVTAGNAVLCTAVFDLLIFELAIGQSLLFESRLQETTATTAAVIIGFIWIHLRNIFLTHRLGNSKPEVVGNFVAKAFTNYLAGILNGKLDLQVFVPIRIGL